MDHKTLVDIAYKFVLKRLSCGVAFKELSTYACNGEFPDVIGFGSGGHSVLIECKASISDFKADKRKFFRQNPNFGMGLYRFYCAPAGMINKTDLPPGWGLLLVDKDKISYVFNPYCSRHEPYPETKYVGLLENQFERNIKAEHGVMYSALRRIKLNQP